MTSKQRNGGVVCEYSHSIPTSQRDPHTTAPLRPHAPALCNASAAEKSSHEKEIDNDEVDMVRTERQVVDKRLERFLEVRDGGEKEETYS